MKKCLSVLLVVLLLLAVIPFSASATVDGTWGDNITWELIDKTLTVSGTGDMQDFNEYNYSSSAWNFHRGDVEHIVISEGVTSIGANAFRYYRYNLKSVTIANTVTKIGKAAFEDAQQITEIVIPDSVTEIDSRAFNMCISVQSITLGKNVRTIGYMAFDNCRETEELIIPKSVTSLSFGFMYGSFKIVHLEVESGNPVYYSEGNCIIEDETDTVVAGCQTSEIPTDGTVKHIGEMAFAGQSELYYITIPDGVLSIGGNAFENCEKLYDITIPESVTEIYYPFSGCTDLTIGTKLGSCAWNYAVENDIMVYNTLATERIEIKELPTKTVYPIGQALDLTGLKVTAYCTGGISGEIPRSCYETNAVNMNAPGVKTVRVIYYDYHDDNTYQVLSCSFEITVDESLGYCFESLHPIPANSSEYIEYVHSTPAKSLNVTFSEDTCFKNNDYIVIFDGNNEFFEAYSGDMLCGETLIIPGGFFSMSVSIGERSYGDYFYGYKITEITANVDESCQHTHMTETYYPRTLSQRETTSGYCEDCGTSSLVYGLNPILDLNSDGFVDYGDYIEAELNNLTLNCDFDGDNEITEYDKVVTMKCINFGYKRLADINYDGESNILDLIRIKKLSASAEIDWETDWFGDINFDNEINSTDVAIVGRFILNYDPMLEEE